MSISFKRAIKIEGEINYPIAKKIANCANMGTKYYNPLYSSKDSELPFIGKFINRVLGDTQSEPVRIYKSLQGDYIMLSGKEAKEVNLLEASINKKDLYKNKSLLDKSSPVVKLDNKVLDMLENGENGKNYSALCIEREQIPRGKNTISKIDYVSMNETDIQSETFYYNK